MRLFSRMVFGTVLTLMAGTAAMAQSVRTFVKSTGADANPCTQAAPCRTLQAGINAVASGGDVIVLDSGAFGANVSITKSVNVAAEPGITARIKADSGGGIYVNAAGVVVTLKGLTIGGTSTGIIFGAGKSLTLHNVDVNVVGSLSFGIYNSAPGGHLAMHDSVVRNSNWCIATFNTSTQVSVRAVISNSRLLNCTIGVEVGAYGTVAVHDSVVSGANVNACINNVHVEGATAIATVDSSVLSNCNWGAYGNSGGVISLSNSLITANNQAAGMYGGAIGQTQGNNRVIGNANNGFLNFSYLVPEE